ncbi:MAG: ABC transporter permease [Clostridiales bacterium]|nr:ABC transporter permease [Clostridiales bacterium]
MRVVKNSIAYVLRKRRRTFIIFVILTLVLSCLYSCLNITKSSNNMERSLYESSNSSVSLMKKDVQGYFEKDEFKNINKIKSIKEIISEYEGLARLINGNVIESKQKIKRDYLSKDLKNLVAIESTSNTKKNILFNSGVFSLKEGRHINKDDIDKILVHSEFAKKNNLKLKDKVSLQLINMTKNKTTVKEHKFEIVGIFTGKKQEKYTGLSSDFSENMMFTDYKSSQKALNTQKDIVNKLTIFASSPKEMKTTITKIKKIQVDWSKYTISKNNNAYREALDALNGVKHIIKIMTYSIMIGGSVILSLILILWLRERIYEIGILLSIGISKLEIIAQFILELLLVSLPSILMSLIFGNLILRQIASGFISSDDTVSITSKFLNDGYNINNLIIFIESYIILILIIIISVVITSGIILMKKPKKILSQIS